MFDITSRVRYRRVHDLICCDMQEGLFTTLFGIFSLMWIPATPADVNLLTPQEKEVYVRVLENDWNTSAEEDETKEEKFSWSEVWSCIIDAPHVLLICIPLFGLGVTVSSISSTIMS